MSPVRRFFILLSTFDVLFTGLIWIITVIVTGRDIKAALHQQVMEYTIYSSMFDCVFVAFLRFFLLLVTYAMFGLSHWWPVATCTTGTSVFAVAKVFLYQWTKFGPITFDVMLVLLSFVISWGELWFLDFRVLPLESKAREIASHFEDTERSPLLINASNPMIQRYLESGGAASAWDGSVANFYSPLESPETSGDEMEEDSLVLIPKKFKRKRSLSQMEQEYRRMGEETLQACWRTINLPDWKLEKRAPSTGDTVHSKVLPGGKKVFKLTGMVQLPPKLLLEELFFEIEHVPKWNPTLTECRIVQPVDSHTDVSYQVCAAAAGGAVSVRDFVNLRHWQVIENGVYVSCGRSVKHPAMPKQPGKIRGENGPGGWIMKPVEGDPEKCLFQWLLDTDLKGWIPQSIIDTALSGAQMEYIEHIREYAEVLRRKGRVSEHFAQQESVAASLNSTRTVSSVA